MSLSKDGPMFRGIWRTGTTGTLSTTGTASGSGGAPECDQTNAATKCDYKNDCTDDSCVMGKCVHGNSMGFTMCGAGKTGSCDGSGTCLTGTALWANNWGGGTQKHFATSIATDKDGNILLSGTTADAITFGGSTLTPAPTLTQAFMLKLSQSGSHIASTLIDGGGSGTTDVGTGITSDMAGNIFVASSSGANGKQLVKFDPNATVMWSKSFGSVTQGCAAVDSMGNVFVAGGFSGTANFGGMDRAASSGSGFVAKFINGGAYAWDIQLKSTSPVTANGCAVDKNGQLIVVGDVAGSTDFGGGVVAYPGNSTQAMFVAKFDGAGNHLWSHIYGTSGTQRADRVTTDSMSNVVLVGGLIGTVNFGPFNVTSAGAGNQTVVLKLSSSGQYLWNELLGNGVGDTTGLGVAVNGSDEIVVAGGHTGSFDLGGGVSSTNPGGFMVKLNSTSGKRYWAKGFDQAFAFGVAYDSSGHEFVTGVLTGQVDFGGVTLMSKGSSDVFVVEFVP